MVGSIDISDVIGSAHAVSVSGSVAVDTEGAGDIFCATVSGGIDIRIPEERAAEIKAKLKSGSLDVDCQEGRDLTIHVATVCGAIKVGNHNNQNAGKVALEQ